MDERTEEIRAVLAAYKTVMEAFRPDLHPAMARRSALWDRASEASLRSELAEYLREASRPDCGVRVFWKLGPQLVFGGCNEHFAHDGGLPDAASMVGLDDFDKRLSWRQQAPKYRKDDKAVLASGKAEPNIIERQEQPDGKVIWVHVGKAPIRVKSGEVIGVLGMYEIIDEATALKQYSSQLGKPSSPS